MKSGTNQAPALVLFDIDGTLMRRAGMRHFRALADAVEQVTGRPAATDGIESRGMLDRDILTLMMRGGGASMARCRTALPELMQVAQDLYVRPGPDLRRKVCRGVRGFLKQLRRAGIPAGLVTGNLSRIGWKKVERAGLKEYFSFGAFADEGSSRAALAKLAIRRARREGLIGRGASISLIGDHPNDIMAAQANHVRSIAVATGLVPRDELAGYNPDVLLNDLRELSVDEVVERFQRQG